MNNLFQQLASLEAQMADKTLSHSDQQLLDQMWEYVNDQIEYLEQLELERINEMEFEYDDYDWDCASSETFDSADEI